MTVYILEAEHKTVPGRIVKVYARRKSAELARKLMRLEFKRNLAWADIHAHQVEE